MLNLSYDDVLSQLVIIVAIIDDTGHVCYFRVEDLSSDRMVEMIPIIIVVEVDRGVHCRAT